MTFLEKVKTLKKLAQIGGEDRLIDQTLSKLLWYAEERARKDLEDITAKLRSLEEQFSMDSDLFSQKFRTGELGDDEAFFRWDALVEMQQRIAQRLAVLQAESSA
jgi:phage-related tail protein